jgi:GNAT superfamily N-acetyltransferase
MVLTLRDIQVEDAVTAAELSAQFGYPVNKTVMEERIQRLTRDSHTVIVACNNEAVVGWIDVGVVEHLQSGVYAEIGGLVVSEVCRSQGIGARLVEAAEQWALERGVIRIVVRSQMAREAAHRFYRRQGYAQTKTSAVFAKVLH